MIGIIIMTLLALILSIILVILDNKANNKNSAEALLEYLPGYNCGACGYTGCRGMAEAILKDPNNYKKCRLLKGVKLEALKNFIDLKK